MDSRDVFNQHQHFFASNSDQLAWARQQEDMVPLRQVLQRFGKDCTEAMFVPQSLLTIPTLKHLPLWVYEFLGWPTTEIAIGDIVHVDLFAKGRHDPVTIMAKVLDTKESHYEVSPLSSQGECYWVSREEVYRINR